MKKVTAILLGLVMVLGLTACSSGTDSETTAAQTTAAQTTEEQTTEAAAETETETTAAQTENGTETETGAEGETTEGEAESEPQTGDGTETGEAGGNTLVVYFSATENTETAANYIAEITGGDLFALEPADPYTDEDLNYNDENSRVVYEHDNPDERDVELTADTVENWDSYDTVFIGYPIWWGIAAWPVDTFIEANDFTGKTVIPFCTSSSSGLGESGQLLAEMAGTGDWQEGIRFSSNVSEEDVQAWIDELGL